MPRYPNSRLTEIAVFYLRMVTERWQRLLLKGITATCLGFGVVGTGCSILPWWPMSVFLMRGVGGDGKCLLDQFVLWGSYAHSILSSIVDWVLGLFPIVMLRNTKMDSRTKGSVIFLLSLGSL